MKEAFKVKNGVVSAKGYIPYAPRIFTDGRMTFFYDESGISQVDYFSKRRSIGNLKIFERDVFSSLMQYVIVDGQRVLPTPDEVSFVPYGITLTFRYCDLTFRLTTEVLDEQLVSTLTIPDGKGHTIGFAYEVYDSNRFIPTETNEFRNRPFRATRKWKDFSYESGVLSTAFHEVEAGNGYDIDVRFYATFPVIYKRIGVNDSIRNVLENKGSLSAGDHSFCLAFDDKPFMTAADILREKRVQKTRMTTVTKRIPRLSGAMDSLPLFCDLVPYYLEFLKTREYPGAVKAKNVNYWIWGWDCLTYSIAYGQMGDTAFYRDMLGFFEEYAANEGVLHYYSYPMNKESYKKPHANPIHSSVTSTLYPILLYNAVTAGAGDGVLREFYPVAKRYMEYVFGKVNEETGFYVERSLYPDYPDLIGETCNDLSSFNNTLFYCALRALEYLADRMGDTDTVAVTRKLTKKAEENYLPLFMDEEKGFPVVSLEATTKEQRPIMYANSVKFESTYLYDVLDPVLQKNLDFFKTHLVNRAGIRPIPATDAAYDGDGNQLHYWFPVTGEYYIRLANACGDLAETKKWTAWISHWTDRIMCPEGINCHADTDRPALDGWTTLNASFQAFSIRPWYNGVIQSVLGLLCEDGTLTLSPTDIPAFTLENFSLPSGKVTVEMKGKGNNIRYIDVNGHRLIGTRKIPSDMLRGNDEIVVTREKEPRPYELLSAHGGEIRDYENGSFTVAGYGTVRLRFRDGEDLLLVVDGQPVTPKRVDGVATYDLRFGEKRSYRILCGKGKA